MAFSQPLMLTDEPRQNWQATLAVNPLDNQTSIIKVGRPPILPVGANAQLLIGQLASQQVERFAWQGLSANISSDDTLDVLTICLTPTLRLTLT